MATHATAEQDSITRTWLVKRGSKVIKRDMSKHEAAEMVRTLQANDAWLAKAKVNEYYRQSRGY